MSSAARLRAVATVRTTVDEQGRVWWFTATIRPLDAAHAVDVTMSEGVAPLLAGRC